MNRVALITGASRGIGRAIALALAGRGWSIVVNYRRNAPAAAAVVEAIVQAGGRAHSVQADISAAAGRAALVEETLRQYQRLDLLVNNAGMAPRQRTDLLATSEASYDEVMAVNLKGPFFLTQLVAGRMIALQTAGIISAPRIINIGSLSAYTSSLNRPEYCLSKAGVAMMTQLFAHRLAAHGIGVYEIRPGIIATDMTSPVKDKYDGLIQGGLIPLQRWGLPEDVAMAVVAIAEGLLPYSTGEVINVDGGFHLRRL
ncbi:MAG: 3-ketoacyl-ACP reductase [candidate division KSB1 bacterium]|nr:3-ketoacyl-ACP reductase [candidate division KSB1 bacterium]MDZ7276235.1 3-ketoacyl-ACP reductase [candidate division KSB1 bacterium]MDZ7287959.1 3-ketoacyl-ACP reductase [candidate division KSB1 bacterium]MDZ7300028.1 3-ketoacyl-ACP reductase [candidate division KSB1 bacterium]MDZ7308418.1 3-ketoacyl-ACP reductase [candidate division KSB1 bacterium]